MTKPTGRLTVVLTVLFMLVALVPAVSNAAAPSQPDALLAWKSSLGDPAA
jgi:Na+-transporting methylmalonyl-CoA/oxaloacetate decarboxylase gamma subunit